MVSAIKNVLTMGRGCYISTSRERKMRSTVNVLYKLGSRNPDNRKYLQATSQKTKHLLTNLIFSFLTRYGRNKAGAF
jgi:hypothetical protein